jgi:hypothetical protein
VMSNCGKNIVPVFDMRGDLSAKHGLTCPWNIRGYIKLWQTDCAS